MEVFRTTYLGVEGRRSRSFCLESGRERTSDLALSLSKLELSSISGGGGDGVLRCRILSGLFCHCSSMLSSLLVSTARTGYERK